MSEYKLVPMEPTKEMIDAAEDAYMPFGDMDLAIRMAVLAAPDVQGEPAYWLVRNEFEGYMQFHDHPPRDCDISPYGLDEIIPLYTAPQPAPDVAEIQAELERERKRRFAGNEQASREHREDMKSLVEALELALEYWRDRQQRYKNRRPKWVISAESALAAHRSQGDEAQ